VRRPPSPDGGAQLERTLRQIESAFAGAPRPPDERLLHERSRDDNDIAALYAIAHWRDVPDAVVENEYAALSFLSPEGFRHFIPAYMRFALRQLGTGRAAVDSTIWSLSPDVYEDPGLRDYVISKLRALDDAQRAAVVAFLEAVRAQGDDAEASEAERALTYWRARRASSPSG
jgi:hypothetical protein